MTDRRTVLVYFDIAQKKHRIIQLIFLNQFYGIIKYKIQMSIKKIMLRKMAKNDLNFQISFIILKSLPCIFETLKIWQ